MKICTNRSQWLLACSQSFTVW